MEIMAGVAALVLLLLICAESGGNKTQKGDLRIGRDSSGEWYVYERETGREVYRSESKKECAEYIKEAIGN